MSFTLALIGRPNVGKSTLFNRLVGKRLALVDDRPGVTRDLREGEGRLGPLRFTVTDTAGLEEAPAASLAGRMRKLSERAIAKADICLFIIDARQGVTPADEVFAAELRKSARATLLVANKAEGRAGAAGLVEAYGLGLGDPIALSAEHGEGLDDLLRALTPLAEGLASAPVPSGDRPLQVAVLGRPNAGKSTLINAILGEDRLLTGPEAGITRDAIAVEAAWAGRAMRIFDTAGMRKRAKIEEKLEKLAVSDGLRAIRFAEVAILLLDAATPFEQQDLRLADLVEREGRALVIAVNKWDGVRDRQARLHAMREMLDRLLPQLAGVPLVTVSALTGQGLDRLGAAVIAAHEVWNRRVPTARLNRWLAGKLADHPPPAPSGRRLKLRYMTQSGTRPPEFVIFGTTPDRVPDAYLRYLVNGLRADFKLPGTPIRLALRAAENPFAGRG
jgi:GTP-binding protein